MAGVIFAAPVFAQTGSIKVTISPSEAVNAGAQWRAELVGIGWTDWYISGKTVSGFRTGTTAIQFKSISGWNKPSDKSVTVSAGGTSTTSGTYEAQTVQTGSIKVTISPSEAVNAGAQWRAELVGIGWTDWYISGKTVSGFRTGTTAIQFKSISGWNKPSDKSVTVSAGGTSTTSGTYEAQTVQTGSIKVTISPSEAVNAGVQWQIDGGTWKNSGATVSNISVGNHTVSFKSVSGWTTPASQTVYVSANSSPSINVTYIQPPQYGSVQVNISPSGAVSTGGQWCADGGSWQNSGAVVSNLSVGNHTIGFKTVNGWNTPDSQSVYVRANSTATVNGTYTQQAQYGSVQVNISPSGAVSAGGQWCADGGSWQSSSAVVSNLAVGNHTISFKTVNGWNTPDSQSVYVRANSTATVNGTYTQQAQYGSVQVNISPSGAVSAGGQWCADGGSWQNSGAVVSNLSAGNHTVSFKAVNGWTAPSSQSVSVVANSTYTGSGIYQQIPTDGYHSYFEDACQKYHVPCNLLKAVAHVESGWNQSAHNGNDWGVMQLNESGLLTIAQRLKDDYPGDYGSMTDQAVTALLKENSNAGARANILGGASKLRWDADNVTGLIYDGEPQESLEVWWFVLAYYNGGGADGSLNTSNYPYRVYNCFLRGVKDADGDMRVPQIPITLPPHFSFEKATQAELDNGEVTSADRNLIPHTPEGFIRRTESFNACNEMGHLHDNDGNELDLPDCQPDEFVLESPLEGYTAYDAPINAVFDYSRPDYTEDSYVIDYLGEVGEKRFGDTYGGYKQADGTSFVANGNYTAAGYGSQYLFYDGHKGVDFRTKSTENPSGLGTKVFATASGTFHTTGDTWNMAYIEHGNGYRTYYLHCQRNFEVTNGSYVNAGDLIGYSGSEGSTDGAHLHIDIRKGSGSSWFPVDPYGWQADEPYNWTRAVNAELWAGGIGGDKDGTPQSLTATEINSEAKTTLSWKPPVGTNPDSYNVYRDDILLKTVSASQLIYTDSDLENGTEYCYYVKALVDGQESSGSNKVCVKADSDSGSHFTPVWDNNPWMSMNFYVVEAQINGVSLETGDEVAVFDGEKCVGVVPVDGEISIASPLELITSMSYEGRDGFTPLDKISFRIWDASEKAEIGTSDITASFFKLSGEPVDPAPTFMPGADHAVRLGASTLTLLTHKIPLINGPNIISSYLIPARLDMLSIFQPLIDNGSLELVEDERGSQIVELGGEWGNHGIEDFSYEEGYRVRVKKDTELIIEGTPVELPVSIPLVNGSNIIGYPVSYPQNSQTIFGSLMDDGSLIKVSDERDKRIAKVFGKWLNTIGDLMPGEGYVVQVNKNSSLEISDGEGRTASRSTSRRKKRDDREPVHFTPAWKGNPYNSMNFWVVGIDAYGIEPGDEIGVFDGDKCVGVGVVDNKVSPQNILTITTSQDYGRGDGFTEGNNAIFRFWDSSTGIEITDAELRFLELSGGNEISAPVFEKYGDYGVILRMGYTMNEFSVNVRKDISSVIDVLSADSEQDESVLTITEVSEPIHGTAVVNTADNTIIYTPDNGYIGADIFSYTVANGTKTAQATVKVIVKESYQSDSDGDGIPNDSDIFPDNPKEWSDNDRDGIGDNADPDDDNDTIPDDWELENGLNPLADDTQADTDGDGYTNLQEYIAGTDPNDPESYPVPGVFTVGEAGEIRTDWLYDGGAYTGELGMFSLDGMDLSVPDLTAFIAEAVSRVLSGTEGHIILSDPTDKARFSGVLGGEPTDWNKGILISERSFDMKPGDRFALMLVPNSTFKALAADPGTADTAKRPLFSFTSPNSDYGMHVGQVADINGTGMGFVFEDMEFGSSDKDYNDLIVQIRGAKSAVPTIDEMLESFTAAAKRSRRDDGWLDWRSDTELGRKIIAHLEATPGNDDLWTSVRLEAPADLMIYASDESATGKDSGGIPGSFISFTGDGGQLVSLPKIAGDSQYRIVLRCLKDASGSLSLRKYLGFGELSEDTKDIQLQAHQVLRANLSVSSSPDGEAIVSIGNIAVPTGTDGTPLIHDFNGDGDIDDEDIGMTASRWNTCEGDAEFDPFFDLDDDGCITVMDIMQVAK